MEARTKFRDVRYFEEDDKVIHDIDQFRWLQGALYPIMPEEDDEDTSKDYLKKSAVFFNLPVITHGHHSLGGRPFLGVVGNPGELEYGVYFSGQDKNDKWGFWNIFSYNPEIKNKKGLKLKKEPIDNNFRFEMISTEITPFCPSDKYPVNALRAFRFNVSGGDRLEVLAKRAEKNKGDRLVVTYIPDPREGSPLELTTFQPNDNNCWYSKDLNNLIV